MQIQLRLTGGFLLVAVALAVATGWWLQRRAAEPPQPAVTSSTTAVAKPVVMRTTGGLLEVATVRAVERFRRADTREFWGIDLGTTVSIVQAPVTYRYHIPLATEWRHVIRGTTCFVDAPALRPSLPVAFDTTAMEKHTRSGWARFDKQHNLAALERSMTPELERRAASAHYLRLATDAARQTVREFVTHWLLREQQWGSDPTYQVVVRFDGEPPTDAPSAVLRGN